MSREPLGHLHDADTERAREREREESQRAEERQTHFDKGFGGWSYMELQHSKTCLTILNIRSHRDETPEVESELMQMNINVFGRRPLCSRIGERDTLCSRPLKTIFRFLDPVIRERLAAGCCWFLIHLLFRASSHLRDRSSVSSSKRTCPRRYGMAARQSFFILFFRHFQMLFRKKEYCGM